MSGSGAGSAMRVGAVSGVAAYSLWGLFPAFFPLLLPAGPVEILAHRIVWTLLVMLLVLLVTRQLRQLVTIDRRTWALVAAAALFISINWGLYVYTVNSERVSEAALGYFINPLVSVVLGVVLFGERLERPQKVAVGIAAVAVAVLTLGYGHFPYLSIILALSFGMYGVVKKKVRLPATVGLAAEVVVTAPLAVGFLVWLTVAGRSTFTGEGPGHAVLLAASGVVTAIPLLLFAMAAQRIPLGFVGMLQYITPSLQLLWAVVMVGERLDGTQWVGFGLVLVAVLLFSGSQLGRLRRVRRAGNAAVTSGDDAPDVGGR